MSTLDKEQLNLIDTLEDDIDYQQIIYSLYRNKGIVIAITGISLGIGCIHLSLQDKVWEGTTQIVIRSTTNNEGSSGASNIAASGIPGVFSAVNTSLKTEVAILKSPSVLMPVFNYVKAEKFKLGKDLRAWKFNNWKDAKLQVKLKKDTTVLNVTYKDKDKQLIVPVLKKVTDTYQRYSGRSRQQGMRQGIKYLEEQIDIYKARANTSMTEYIDFSMKNGLGGADGLPIFSSTDIKSSATSSPTTSKSTPFAQSFSASELKSQSFNPIDAETMERYRDNFELLALLESELSIKSSLLKPNSEIIKSLKRRIDSLEKSLSRPTVILNEYRQLKSQAGRDQNTLLGLESQISNLKLQRAKQNTPWELISEPTVVEDPIAPNESRILSISLLIGLLTGSIIAYIADKITNIIYSTQEYKSLIPYPLLKTILKDKPETWKKDIDLLASGPLNYSKGEKILLLTLGKLKDQDYYIRFEDRIKDLLDGIQLISNNDTQIINENVKIIIVASPGMCKRNELKLINEDIKFKANNVKGWISLE
ncbi:GumC family protein [Prochlorococcus marinus]|uniref:GumC family protein n=1 Tax=Prochlorococcus marinus TaxID=1219 RepID=UPI0022B4EF85|nr:Wzz/FepE/Etk N-terminal domain-containing protein [Prochlorococcus marinus]